MGIAVREQLHQQIETLPDEVVQVIADFALFVMARRHIVPTFMDWQGDEWQTFALQQFYRENEPVEYTLADAKEVYHQ
ncbi:MAG: hypothetical protein B6D41_11940 [Chloroflexi bacterium UTCFX4]|nr:MAG: hypothetical protein B6D41_11940 [Chloroflexi bacterium UTCFX4]